MPEEHDYQQIPEKEDSKQTQEMKSLMTKFIPLVTVFIILGCWFVYLISPLSHVKSVDIKGNDDLVAQTILDKSAVKKGESIPDILFDKKTYEDQIKKSHPQIKDAKIKIDHYNEVTILIKEYRTVAFLMEDNEYRRVLETGKILEEKESHSHGNYPIISNFDEGDALNQMIKELDQVDQPILTLISEIELTPSDTNPLLVKVFMNSGNIVKASIPDFAEKMNYFPQMVQAAENRKGVFDLEVGAYFTPFSELNAGEQGSEQLNEEETTDLSSVDDESDDF